MGGTGQSGRLKVLHLIDTLRPGGAEQLIATTVRHLDPQRFESVVATLFPPLDLKPTIECSNVPVHHLALRGFSDWRRGILGLAQLLRRERIDILHTHLAYANLYGRLAGLVARVPAIVTTLHHLDYSHWSSWRLRFMVRKSIDWATSRWLNAGFIAVSQAVRDDYVRHLGLNGIAVIHNYIDPHAFPLTTSTTRVTGRSAFGWGPRHFVLLNVARLDWDKGQEHLLRAMPHVREAIPEARALFVGDGPKREALEVLARELGVEGVVTFTGIRQDIVPLLGMADLFVFPSVAEGLGIALLEAMAAGLPVVASRVEGITEVVEDDVDGVMVPPGNPQAIARAVIRLSRDPVLQQALGTRARRTIEMRFNATDGVRKLQEVYVQLATRNGA